MTTLYYDADADLSRLTGRRVAIIGYGSQGHAHALNLRDSGVDVRVGLPEGSKSRAERRGGGAARRDAGGGGEGSRLHRHPHARPHAARGVREAIAPNLTPGKTLLFAHGFNIRFGEIDAERQGRRRHHGRAEGARSSRARGVHRGRRRAGARRRASGQVAATRSPTRSRTRRGSARTRAGVLQTTFAEETETDLFGEQAVLCGGASALVKAGFETLVKNGYQPEIAYFECLHELKLIVDLMYRGGMNYMRHSVSDTAEYGDYIAGDRIVTDGDARPRCRSCSTR